MEYLPLAFYKSGKIDNPDGQFSIIKEIWADMDGKGEITEEEFVRFGLSSDFADPCHQGRFQPINEWMFSLDGQETLYGITGINLQQYAAGDVDWVTEWRDILVAPCLFDRWARNKQVYSPDRDFAEALLRTQNLQLHRDILQHLPTNYFFVEFPGGMFAPMKGAFVFVENGADHFCFTSVLITEGLQYFSHYFSGVYGPDGTIKLALDDLPTAKYDLYSYDGTGNAPKKIEVSPLDESQGRSSATWFLFQMTCYLVSNKPDIAENPITKSTYRKSTFVKNKFSEIQKWDVGVRFGKTIRIQTSNALKQEQTDEQGLTNDDLIDDEQSKASRKSPIPHFRCAHWHRYWTGEGRKTCEVKWIEPIFVGFNAEECDVVIHRVKK